ncbi:MAG TPA: hypothetical protein VIQ62_01460 [Burkholderiales bacterium]
MANETARTADHDAEDAYWRENYTREPYYQQGYTYEFYVIAYRVGYEGRSRYGNKRFDEAEPELRAEYERNRGSSPLTWDQSRDAVKAAWHRLDRMFPDSD